MSFIRLIKVSRFNGQLRDMILQNHMIKISSITALGILVLIVASPFVSISRTWKDYILMACGLVIAILSYLIRKELHKVIRIVHGVEEIKSDTYVESNPQ